MNGAYPLSVSFLTPDDQFPPSSLNLPAVNLFLFELHENRELRSFEPELQRQDNGTVLKRHPPARVDCHYLVTVCARDGVQNPELYEHRLLGAVLQVLLRYRRLPPAILQGSLKDQEPPVRASTQQPVGQHHGVEIWHALRGKPRAALHYVLTLSLDVHASEELGGVVREVRAS